MNITPDDERDLDNSCFVQFLVASITSMTRASYNPGGINCPPPTSNLCSSDIATLQLTSCSPSSTFLQALLLPAISTKSSLSQAGTTYFGGGGTAIGSAAAPVRAGLSAQVMSSSTVRGALHVVGVRALATSVTSAGDRHWSASLWSAKA